MREWQFGLVFATAIAMAGCAVMRRQEARETGDLLVSAGFQAKAADTPERAQQLGEMPPLKMVSQSEDGRVVYRYADPYGCECLYVGDEEAYGQYQRLAVQRQLAEERLQDVEDAAVDWGPGGPSW